MLWLRPATCNQHRSIPPRDLIIKEDQPTPVNDAAKVIYVSIEHVMAQATTCNQHRSIPPRNHRTCKFQLDRIFNLYVIENVTFNLKENVNFNLIECFIPVGRTSDSMMVPT